MTPLHSGEVQFVTFADSSKGGPRITLRLSDREELEAFVGMEGRRFMLALVLIGDDETPAEPPAPKAEPEKPKGGELAKLAGMWCNDPEFQKWLTKNQNAKVPYDAETAAAVVRAWCGISTRAQLDHIPLAASHFKHYFRDPYHKHLISIGATA